MKRAGKGIMKERGLKASTEKESFLRKLFFSEKSFVSIFTCGYVDIEEPEAVMVTVTKVC